MEVRWLSTLVLLSLLCAGSSVKQKFTGFKNVLTVSDLKEWKKVIKTRNNVLALFADGKKPVSEYLVMFEKVAGEVRGKGTLVFVDCADEAKKMCKKLKVERSKGYAFKHYKSGSYHKEYDRLMTVVSMISFMNDPSADPPWYEDPEASSVRHVIGPHDLEALLRTEKNPILMFFYAPWCGHCKRMKPELAAAAADPQVKDKYVLAGMNVDNPESFIVREQFNITGFPTIVYFENGEKQFDYGGGRDKEGILEWLKNPQPPEDSAGGAEAEQPWSEVESDVVHLTDDTFNSTMMTTPSALVMFYAPWCGHCKAMKPAYAEAATLMKERGIPGKLVAVDATKEQALGKMFDVKGYPSLRYFANGELMYEYGYGRTAEDIVKFMQDPQEPPPPEKEWSEEDSEVNHLTDETFKSFLKKKKHALVMFYAPWCGHCKAAKPEFTMAAASFSGDKKRSFAALDCTKFQSVCEQFDVSGYPTFKYFSYGKNPSPYNGDRSSAGFSEFIGNPEAFLREEL